MNKNILKKTGIVFASTVGVFYGLFLIAPFILTPIVNNYIPMVNTEIQKATGLNSRIENFKILTTPKLTVGAKLGEFLILTPDNKEILKAENFAIKMSLLPLFTKKIEIDSVQLDSFEMKLGVNNDGSFEVEKYLPKTTEITKTTTDVVEPMNLPFGLRLSNHLPNIKLGDYDLEFINLSNGEKYEFEGEKTEITDFVLNKSIKFTSKGSAKLINKEQFTYNVKINNKIMPDIELHDLVFAPVTIENEQTEKQEFKINILNILKSVYNNNITANIDADIRLSKSGNTGYLIADNLSIVNLPKSNVKLNFKGNKIDIDSALYTEQNEVSTIKGYVNTDKKTNIDLNLKSNIEINNIIKILNAIALTFDIKDLQTLSANGKLNADFNIKSDSKTINSNGFFKIPSANIYYGIYNIGIDNINADIELANNNVNINNVGFSILNQPLKFYGKITQDAKADLHLLAENLSLKGLLIACGQAVILKENPVNSGLISLQADIVGALDKIKPTAKVALNNIDIKNVPSNTTLKLPNTNIEIVSDGKTFTGNAYSDNIKIINPAASINIPKITANIMPDVIEITKTPVKVEKINFNVEGKIRNYLTEKLELDFITTGDIKSKLSGNINILKQTLNLIFGTVSDSTIIVPMFDKSKMTFNGNVHITGNMMNPQLSGVVHVPTLSIPEIPVVMENLVAKLNGPILKGQATLGKFASGGIAAQNIVTDFSMKGENFYLSNMKGDAFDGKINGNIIYNMSNFNTNVDFHGQNLNAEKAVAGAIGISNALSGLLGFDTKLTLKVVDYEEMMRSIKGKLTFKVDNGSFGNIGRIENFFNANNIVSNALLKTTVASLSNLEPIKNTAEFDYIKGDIDFSNGWANLNSIKSTGKTLAYYVNGKLNLINMTTNVVILGRLDESIVKLLGPIGELSADRLLSAIPKFGTLTAIIAKDLTSNPKGEKISEIPTLSNESKIYKDFKVTFNGGIESNSSIKSFKWLNDVDTSAIEQSSIKETLKTVQTSVSEDVKSVIDTVKTQKELLKDTAGELKNLFKF